MSETKPMVTQREKGVSLTSAQRKAVAELFPELVARLRLAENKVRAIPFTLGELKRIQHQCEAACVTVTAKAKRNSLRLVAVAMSQALDDAAGIRSIPAADRLYQFKITLLKTEPPIWRRIQIKNGTLDRLHVLIQTAMGWTNSHLHQFEIKGEKYGDLELLDDGFDEEFDCRDSRATNISQIVPQDGSRFRFQYEYDFGDGWEHEVLFEGCLKAEKGTRYPLCVEGERACPPEDVGGVWGFHEFLEALGDPRHEQHTEFHQWAGPYDPAAFDRQQTTRKMRRGLPDWRQCI